MSTLLLPQTNRFSEAFTMPIHSKRNPSQTPSLPLSSSISRQERTLGPPYLPLATTTVNYNHLSPNTTAYLFSQQHFESICVDMK